MVNHISTLDIQPVPTGLHALARLLTGKIPAFLAFILSIILLVKKLISSSVKEIKIIEVKSEIGAGTRGASLGVEAVKIASLDLKSDLFRKYDSIEVENVNELTV
jgi:hypothetical protein